MGKFTKAVHKCRVAAFSLVCMAGIVAFSLAASAERVQIEHFVSTAWAQTGFEAYKKIADMFNKSQDKIQVNVVMATGNYEETVVTRIVGGAAPDVITSNKYGDLAPKGILMPLDAFAKRDNVIAQLLPPGLEQSTWNGELLMLPQAAQPFITYYNPNLFGLAGISDPYALGKTGKWTWDTVSSSARKISADKDSDGKYDIWGMAGPVHWQQRTIMYVIQAGGKYFDRWVNPTKATYDSPGVVQALTFLSEQVQKNAMPYEAAATANHVPQFVKGNVGFLFEGPWTMAAIRTAGFTDWDVAPVPKGPANAGTAMMVDGVQMLRATPHPQEAWEWMKYLVTNEAAYTSFTIDLARPPAALRGLQQYLKTVVQDGRPGHTDTFVSAIMNPVTGPCIPIVTNVTKMNTAFNQEILKFLKNEQSLQAALMKMNQVADTILQEVKAVR